MPKQVAREPDNYNFKASVVDDRAGPDAKTWVITLQDGVLEITAVDDNWSHASTIFIGRKGCVLGVLEKAPG